MKNLTKQIKSNCLCLMIILSGFMCSSSSHAESVKKMGFINKGLKNMNEKCINSMAVTKNAFNILKKEMKENGHKTSHMQFPSRTRSLCKFGLLSKNFCNKIELNVREQIKKQASKLGFKFKINLHNDLGIYSVNMACSNFKHKLGIIGSKTYRAAKDIMNRLSNKLVFDEPGIKRKNPFNSKKRCEVVVEEKKNLAKTSPKNVQIDSSIKTNNDNNVMKINNIPSWSYFAQDQSQNYIMEY